MRSALRWISTEPMALVLAAFYVGLLLSGALEKLAIGSLLLLGLWSLRDAATRRALAAQAGLFLAFAALPFAAALSWLANGLPDEGLKMFGKYARFLLVVPLYAAAWRWLRPQALWEALLLTAGVMALWNVAEALMLIDICLPGECWPGRLNGAIHHIQYGGIGLALAAMLLAGMPRYSARGRPVALAAMAAVTFLLFGAFGSGARIVYLALIPTLLCWLMLQYRRGPTPWRSATAALFAVACAASFVWPLISHRTDEAVTDVVAYQQGQHAKAPSVGARLTLWRTSAEIFADHPLTGAGEFRPAAVPRATPEQYPSGLPSHPHSEYWAAASSRGLIGVAALLVALGWPLWRFGRTYLAYGSPAAMAGVLMILVLAQVALTESIFRFSSFSAFYVMTTAVIAAVLAREHAERGET